MEFDQDVVVNNPFLKDFMIYVEKPLPPLFQRTVGVLRKMDRMKEQKNRSHSWRKGGQYPITWRENLTVGLNGWESY